MFIKDWKKELFSIPNLLSFFRIILLPVYVYIYLNASQPREYLLAGSILGLSCLTDMVDGKIARKFNMITKIGKVLDPFADKLTQLTLTICLSLRYPVLYPVLALFLVKECFQLIVAIIQFRRGKVLPGALLAGKVCTTVLFVSFIILVLFPNLTPFTVRIIALTDSAFLGFAFVSYILAFLGKNNKMQDVEP